MTTEKLTMAQQVAAKTREAGPITILRHWRSRLRSTVP